jgi:Sphingosine kinase and enzymes related to eukaryotic diacylglycerol kinase
MTRPDWQEACKIPLGAIPGGSGNAIVKNMCDKAGEECSLESAAYLIAKGRTVPIDLAAIEQSDGHKLFSFLSFNWAVISDLDIESEK